MYTIKQAATRTGVPVALLRAWERRYGIVEPARTDGGYRLYDEAAIDRLRAMRRLVDEGWAPSVAAAAIVSGEVPATSVGPDGAPGGDAAPALIEGFTTAAAALDAEALESVLDAMFAMGSFEVVADDLVLPALGALGDGWAAGRIDIAAEHAASHAVLRRLGAAFQAAGRPATTSGAVLVGLPPGSRHELGALAFAIGARRAGLPVLYLGPDLPVSDWIATALRARPQAAVIAVPTPADVAPGVEVGRAIAGMGARSVVAFGGRGAVPARDALPPDRAIALPDGVRAAVTALSRALAPSRRGSRAAGA